MNSKNYIIAIIVTILSTLNLQSLASNDAVHNIHNKHFMLSSRKIIIKSDDINTQNHINEHIANNGAIVVYDFFSNIFAPKIVFHKAHSINNSSEGYSIEVGKSKVTVRYTSNEMLSAATKEFEKLVTQIGEQRAIKGCNIYYTTDSKINKTSLKRNSLGVIDGITTKLPTEAIENAIKSQLRSYRDSDFIFAVVNRRVYRVDFKAFNGINAEIGSICESWSYSLDQIKRFIKFARDNGGEFVPAIDLISSNKRFEDFTGHKMTSPEGMRFVRAIIEECANSWGVRRLCIGTSYDELPPYYIDFIRDIASRNGIEIILIDNGQLTMSNS